MTPSQGRVGYGVLRGVRVSAHRAQIVLFQLFELILLLKLDKQFPVEQFEATVSQSTVPNPLLTSEDSAALVCASLVSRVCVWMYGWIDRQLDRYRVRVLCSFQQPPFDTIARHQ